MPTKLGQPRLGWTKSTIKKPCNARPALADSCLDTLLRIARQTQPPLRNLANAQGCDWNIEEGTVPFLTPATGLIGTPTQTISGITIKSLLNPMIRAGGQVRIVNKSLSTVNQRIAFNKSDLVGGLDKGGFYKALQVIQTGDSRGNAWYTDMLCTAVDGTQANNPELIVQVPDDA
jgi:hypothetical protein